MLLRDSLSEYEQVALAQLKHHPGYVVLVKLMEEACTLANAEPIKLDPDDDKYDDKLKNRTLYARSINDFCSSVLKSVEIHIETIRQKTADDQEEARIEEEADRLLDQLNS